jgi:probable H4MPT-linked C1 transfer pathway protein
MRPQVETWIAFDIGGANVKAAHSEGAVASVPFELWRCPGELAEVVAHVTGLFPRFDRVALTMTAELCDCFPTKRDGVVAVLDAAARATAGHPLRVWGLDGALHPPQTIRDRPLLAAAANWLALATAVACLAEGEPGLLIDIGSTTTDLIPFRSAVVAARGRTDTERLQTGELVYAGTRRTPVFALASRLPFRGQPTRLMAELFATTLDVFLTLGEIPEASEDRSTADGRPATILAARDRLARMVGADREGFSADDARQFSGAVREILVSQLAEAVDEVCHGAGVRPAVVVTSGSGEFLAADLATRVFEEKARWVSLSQTWGRAASAAACARALVQIAAERRDCAE